MPRQKATYVDDPVELGQRLHTLRRGARLTLRELAFPGCSAGYLSRIERGERVPSLQILVELGRRLGVSAQYLARGEGQNGACGRDLEAVLGEPDGPVLLESLSRALETAQTSTEAVWILTSIGQLAAIRGDRVRAIGALKQALSFLRAGDAPERAPAPASLDPGLTRFASESACRTGTRRRATEKA